MMEGLLTIQELLLASLKNGTINPEFAPPGCTIVILIDPDDNYVSCVAFDKAMYGRALGRAGFLEEIVAKHHEHYKGEMPFKMLIDPNGR